MTHQCRKVLATAFAYIMTLGIVGIVTYIHVVYWAGYYIFFEQSWRGVVASLIGAAITIMLPVFVARRELLRMSAQ